MAIVIIIQATQEGGIVHCESFFGSSNKIVVLGSWALKVGLMDRTKVIPHPIQAIWNEIVCNIGDDIGTTIKNHGELLD